MLELVCLSREAQSRLLRLSLTKISHGFASLVEKLFDFFVKSSPFERILICLLSLQIFVPHCVLKVDLSPVEDSSEQFLIQDAPTLEHSEADTVHPNWVKTANHGL